MSPFLSKSLRPGIQEKRKNLGAYHAFLVLVTLLEFSVRVIFYPFFQTMPSTQINPRGGKTLKGDGKVSNCLNGKI